MVQHDMRKELCQNETVSTENCVTLGESVGGTLAETGKDGQYVNVELLPVSAAHGGVL